MFDSAITGGITEISDSLLVIIPAALTVGAGLLAARIGWRALRSFIK